MGLKKKYVVLISFILTIIIFSSGIIFGWSFEKYKSDVIYDELKHNELNTESYLTEQEFIDEYEETLLQDWSDETDPSFEEYCKLKYIEYNQQDINYKERKRLF